MTGSISKLSLFVAHAFQPRSKAYTRKDFKQCIASIARELQNAGVAQMSLMYGVAFDETVMSEALIRLMQTADIAIIELSDNNPNVLYEYGYLSALGRPCLLVRNKKVAQRGPDVPADIKGRMFIEYEDLVDLQKRLHSPLRSLIEKRALDHRITLEKLYRIWFPQDVQNIHVVAGHEYESVSSIRPESENYTFLDRFCDKDAVLEVMSFLSRTYPRTRIVKYTDREFLANLALQDNLVIIGGPGSDGGLVQGGNKICRLFRTRLNSSISYSDDCEEMLVARDDGNVHRHRHLRAEDVTKQDWGYFASFENPYRRGRRIVMIHGLHTFGVLGGTHVFSDQPEAYGNVDLCLGTFGDQSVVRFECYFKVRIEQGVTLCPSLEHDQLIELEIRSPVSLSS